MASAFTHSFIALAAGKLAFPERLSARIWMLGVLCSLLPDLDVIGFRFGVPFGQSFGPPRVLPFPAVRRRCGSCSGPAGVPQPPVPVTDMVGVTAYFIAVTASHGVLDAMTNGGYGIAFFSPFSNARFFLPWRPLLVAPIGVYAFFTRWGWDVLMSELLWIWLPMTLLLVIVSRVRGQRSV